MKTILKYSSVILLALFLFSCSDTLTELQTKSFVKFYGSYQVDKGEEVPDAVRFEEAFHVVTGIGGEDAKAS